MTPRRVTNILTDENIDVVRDISRHSDSDRVISIPKSLLHNLVMCFCWSNLILTTSSDVYILICSTSWENVWQWLCLTLEVRRIEVSSHANLMI